MTQRRTWIVFTLARRMETRKIDSERSVSHGKATVATAGMMKELSGMARQMDEEYVMSGEYVTAVAVRSNP